MLAIPNTLTIDLDTLQEALETCTPQEFKVLLDALATDSERIRDREDIVNVDGGYRDSIDAVALATDLSCEVVIDCLASLKAKGYLAYTRSGDDEICVYLNYTSDTDSAIIEPQEKPKRKNPYPPEWTKELRYRIKERDGHRCTECGANKPLCVHHIDSDKQNCNEKNLITLCRRCHRKAHGKRESWSISFYRGTNLSERYRRFGLGYK